NKMDKYAHQLLLYMFLLSEKADLETFVPKNIGTIIQIILGKGTAEKEIFDFNQSQIDSLKQNISRAIQIATTNEIPIIEKCKNMETCYMKKYCPFR
ncbi:MAG: hypothetical protein N2440_04055, partial [Actinobacteria bacterium]|nr:hypothetical protein [Actinomycetota bacterium]